VVRDAAGQPKELVGVWTDVTERRQAEGVMRESERRFQEMLENVQMIALTLNRDGIVTFCNNYLLRLTGWTREEVIGSNWFARFIPKSEFAVGKLFFDHMATGTVPAHHENPILSKDGRQQDIFWNNTMLRDAAGNVIGTASLGEDVTERKRAEAKLRESEEFKEAILDSVASHIAVLDRQGFIVEVNARWRRFALENPTTASGLTPNLGVGANYLEVCRRSTGKSALEALAACEGITAVIEGAKTNFVLEYPCHGPREWRWFSMNVTPLGREGRFVVVSHTNITERKRAEEALRESEEKFRQLAENINEVFWITDPGKHQMLYLSPAFEEIWGRTCESVYQSSKSWLEAIHPDDRQRVLTAAVNKQHLGEYDESYRIVRPDGSIRWIHDRAYPVNNESGQVYRIVGTAEDITQRKETEKQLRQAQKMESIGLLAGGVAHDFNNILLIIQINLEMVLLDGASFPVEAKEHLAEIGKAADRAGNLNRQLLAFSRTEAMQMQLLDLNDLTSSFSRMLRRIVGENIRVQNDLAAVVPAVQADPGMIEQVLMNLAVNARDAMPKGGRLIIGTELVAVDEAEAKLNPRKRAGRFACLSVRDTGTGIAPEHMPRIFEPFFTTKGVGKGTGLGLATVFGIAEQHKGWVDVSSTPGAGTTFRLFLPLSSEGAGAASAIVPKKICGGTERILLVEDEQGVREVLFHTLANFGYAVLAADSGVAALKTWQDHTGRFDLLITDMVMPGGLTGLDLINLLRAEKPALKVLLMSGYSQELARGNLAGASDIVFLHKPFPTRVLAETVRHCLDTD
jgi:PAS domain S-box-containing protein